MFVRKSTFDKLQKESNYLFAKFTDMLVELMFAKLEIAQLRRDLKGRTGTTTTTSLTSLTSDELLKIIACTHPDKHNGDKAMGDITAKLLEMRKAQKA